MDNIGILRETLHICDKRSYDVDGKRVALTTARKDNEEAIVLLPKDIDALIGKDLNRPFVIGRCSYSCENIDSFSAAEKMNEEEPLSLKEGSKPVLVLNYANPVHPGGGVRRGARAQEEDLCRKSTLLIALEGRKARRYYEYNRSLDTFMGSDALIITPKIEVFRDADGSLLKKPFTVAVLTCAAPMITYGLEGMSPSEYEEMVAGRISRMLKVAAYHGYERLVLGAWGCGAFRNDAKIISDLFYQALKQLKIAHLREKDLFQVIRFAVLDRQADEYNFKQFYRNFGADNFYRTENSEEKAAALKRIKESEKHLDKIKGSLFGGAIGDALGYPIEFLDEQEIADRYGKEGIQEYELDPIKKKALISDDTQMSLFTANGVLFAQTRAALRGIGGEPRTYMLRFYQDWLRTQEQTFGFKRSADIHCPSWLIDVPELYSRRAPGNTCLSALKSLAENYYPEDGSFISHPLNDSKGCGGIMRAAPLAMAGYENISLAVLAREGAELAAITHGHSLAYMSAAVLVHLIHQIIYTEKERSLMDMVIKARDTVKEIFKDDRHIDELVDIIDLAISLAANDDLDPDNIHRLGEGWVAEETLAISLYCALKYSHDFSKAITVAVNHKGDSDSTGAVTGNIVGAYVGYDNIAEKWKTALELSDVIQELAADLCHGCQMSEYGSYQDENWLQKYVR